jgi:hypothetical protein
MAWHGMECCALLWLAATAAHGIELRKPAGEANRTKQRLVRASAALLRALRTLASERAIKSPTGI